MANTAIIPTGSPFFTISAWILTTSSRGALFGQYASPGATGSDTSHFFLVNSSVAAFDEYPPSGGMSLGTITLNDGQWHHVAVVVRGGAREFYVDGQLDTTSSQEVYAGAAPNEVWLGARYYRNFSPNNTHTPYAGFMDEVRLYGYAQCEIDVRRDYQAGLEAQNAM